MLVLKKSLLLGAICVWLFLAVSDALALTVATYNVQNYLSANRMVDGTYRRDYPKPEDEKRALRTNIIAVSPDILALQEMGELPYLEELQRDLKRDGLDYPYAYLGVGIDQVRHTAVLSKIKPIAVKKHLDLRFKYFDNYQNPQRGLLELKFAELKGLPAFSLYVVHLKSKRTVRKDDFESNSMREKEARVIRDRVLRDHGEGPDAAYLVVGDFNDLRNAAPLARFQEIGGRKTGKLLDVRDGDGFYWTYYWSRAHLYSRIDYIVAGAAMFESWTGTGGIYGETDGSDHRLVWADFDDN